MFAYTTTLRTPSMMPAFTSTSRSRWKSMLDSVRSSRERVKLARDEERQHDGLAGLRESLLGPVRRREFELWIHRDGNAAALVAIEVELPADRSRPDAGLVTLSGLIGGGIRVLHDSRDQLLM